MHPSPSPQTPHDLRHELDHVMEEAGDVVFRLDATGTIAFASKRAATLSGRLAPLRGLSLARLLDDADQAPLAADRKSVV